MTTSNNKKIRTRFAPSPTGFVHIGSLRTALFSHLWAKHNDGTTILRIEDTDQNRKVEGAIENLLQVMKTMGIEFDEGFYMTNSDEISERGDFGPYLQSKRLGLYKKFAQKLIEEKKAYYCFCSQERLDELKKEQTALKKPPMYDRHCYFLTQEKVQSNLQNFSTESKSPVIRFLIPEGTTIVHDLIYGDIQYENRVLDDQVILKSDGFPTYHLAVVVDDHHMEITHVIRGDEWISSTPKHILLYQALGWQPTEFAHTPLILNPDKSKLSKRQGDVSVEDFLKKGYLPEALLNFVAFLGWNPKSEKEIFSLQDLIKDFELKNVNKSGAVLDLNKLDWVNGLYIRGIPTTELTTKLKPFWKEAGIEIEKFEENYLQLITELEKERLKKLSEIGERTKYFFEKPEYSASILTWKKSTPLDAKEKLSKLAEMLETVEDFSKENLELVIKEFVTQNGGDNGSVLWPMRVSLTGQEKSPGPFEVASTLAVGLGKMEVISRLKLASEKL